MAANTCTVADGMCASWWTGVVCSWGWFVLAMGRWSHHTLICSYLWAATGMGINEYSFVQPQHGAYGITSGVQVWTYTRTGGFGTLWLSEMVCSFHAAYGAVHTIHMLLLRLCEPLVKFKCLLVSSPTKCNVWFILLMLRSLQGVIGFAQELIALESSCHWEVATPFKYHH